jgi:hypothetical protein
VISKIHSKFRRKLLSNVCDQIACIIRANVKIKTKRSVIKMFKCKEKTTSAMKKKESRVTTDDTVLADDNKAIVLIEDTMKIFSERRSEYSPKAYSDVIVIRVRNLAGTKK